MSELSKIKTLAFCDLILLIASLTCTWGQKTFADVNTGDVYFWHVTCSHAIRSL